MPVSGEDALGHFRDAGYRFLAIEPEHAAAMGTLANHHQDPLDRILVAQALVELMRRLTHDATATVAKYSDSFIFV
jgi:PIN domain nuclease of toxin-antitoxin system